MTNKHTDKEVGEMTKILHAFSYRTCLYFLEVACPAHEDVPALVCARCFAVRRFRVYVQKVRNVIERTITSSRPKRDTLVDEITRVTATDGKHEGIAC